MLGIRWVAASSLPTLVIGVMLLAAGGSRAAFAQGVGTVDGTVLSARGGSPVSGAMAFVEGPVRPVQTDGRGRFRLTGVPAGRQRVTVQRIGFRPVTETVEVSAGATSQVTFHLTEAAALLEPMVVTASRGQDEALSELPVAVSVLSGDEIAAMRPTHVGQTLNRLAGVHVVSFDGDGSHNAVRQPLCCRPTILLMEDGIPFAPPSFYTTSMLGGVDYSQAGRVEALKGPGTAAYGSDAVTGVVNFISPTPPLTPSGDVTIEGGGYGYKRAMLSSGGTFGGHGLQFSGTFVDSDGRREDPYQRVSSGVRWNTTFGNGALLRAIVTYNKRDGTGSDDQTPEQFEARSDFNPYPIAFDKWRNLRASLSYQQSAGRTSWSLTPYFRYQDSDRVPGWQLSYNPVVWDIDYRSVGFLSQLRHEFAALNARLTLGIDGDRSPLTRREPVITPLEEDDVWVDWSLTTEAPQYDYEATYRGGAGYAQLDFDPLPRLRVSAGARFDVAEYEYHTKLAPTDTGRFRIPGDTKRDFRKATPKLGLIYSLSGDSKVFASYRRGFRVPLESQLFKQGSSANTTNLDPIEVESTELGVRTAWGERARIEVAAYYMEMHNDILSFRAPGGVSSLTNNGETSHRGVEVSGGVAVASDLRADVAYTYAKHRFESWRPSSTLDLSGREMDGAPRHLVTGTLTYEPRLLNGGRVQLEWNGMSGYWLNPTNTTRFDGYNVFHLRASYVLARRAELYARVMNLTDKLYAAQAFQGFGSTPWVASAGEYRALYAGARLHF